MRGPRGRLLLAIYVGGVAAAVLFVVFVAYQRQTAEQVEDAVAMDARRAETRVENGSPRAPEPPPVPGTLWQLVDPDTVDAVDIPSYKEVVKDRVLVRLVDPLRQLDVGARPVVVIPQLGETYRPVVERVETGPGVIRSVAGHATGSDGRHHRFVFTVGPRSAFARIGTPQGTFELVANGELGWLMPTVNMDQHVDYTKPDTFLVRRVTEGQDDAPR